MLLAALPWLLAAPLLAASAPAPAPSAQGVELSMAGVAQDALARETFRLVLLDLKGMLDQKDVRSLAAILPLLIPGDTPIEKSDPSRADIEAAVRKRLAATETTRAAVLEAQKMVKTERHAGLAPHYMAAALMPPANAERLVELELELLSAIVADAGEDLKFLADGSPVKGRRAEEIVARKRGLVLDAERITRAQQDELKAAFHALDAMRPQEPAGPTHSI